MEWVGNAIICNMWDLLGIVHTLHVEGGDARAGEGLSCILLVALEDLTLQVRTHWLYLNTPERETLNEREKHHTTHTIPYPAKELTPKDLDPYGPERWHLRETGIRIVWALLEVFSGDFVELRTLCKRGEQMGHQHRTLTFISCQGNRYVFW